MKNIMDYCNGILSLVDQVGEQYIYDCKYRHVDVRDLIGDPDDIDTSSEELDRSDACVHLNSAIEVSKVCDALRTEYVRNIKNRLLSMSKKNQNVYAKEILQTLYDIQLGHRIFHLYIFRNFIIPVFFSDVIQVFKRHSIDLQQVLLDCQKEHGNAFCHWLSFIKPHKNTIGVQRCAYVLRSESDDEEVSEDAIDGGLTDCSCGSGYDNGISESCFNELFTQDYREQISLFVSRLEENRIISDGKYNHRTKNYLAKLMIYMRDSNILKYTKYISGARVFYGYFGISVSEVSTREDSVTERNLRIVESKGLAGLSEEEKKDFKYICSVFVKK